MTSPFLQLRLRSLDEAVEDRMLRDLRKRHQKIKAANRKARLVEADNVYRLGPRFLTRIGSKP